MIRVEGLIVRFGRVTALELPALAITQGERVAVRGPNGSGKTTLLRVLAGLLSPTAGSIAGVPRRGRTVLVHQRPLLFRGSAADNVAYALRLQKRPVAEVSLWLERLGVLPFAERSARELSEGEQRRVAIARALATEPELLLLDEPFAPLDAAGARAVRAALEDFSGTLVHAGPGLPYLSLDRVIELAHGHVPGPPDRP